MTAEPRAAAAVEHIRTWLYVPADRPDRISKAATSGADAVIIDLEDAVALVEKPAARAALAGWLDGQPTDRESGRASLWVRINGDSVAEDLAVACHPLVEGICLPKAESVAAVLALAAALDELEPVRRPAGRPIVVMLLVETAQGVLDVAALARASDRVAVLQIGELDLRADLRLPPAASDAAGGPPDGLPGPLQAARDAVVLAAAAARLAPPVAPVSPDVHDPHLADETRRLRASGFGSRAVIHPAQLAPVAEAFAPTDSEIEWATRVVAASDDASARGAGVVLLDGRMVDAPVIAAARTVLHRADRPA